MKAIIKDYSPTMDYCAFMLAIVIVCHSVNAVNTNYQWSAEEISKILNDLPRAKHANFHVNSVALKQGMLLFKRHLHKWGIATIEIFQEEKKSLAFFDLIESRRSIELKFSAYQSVSDETEEKEVLGKILHVRDNLLSLGNFVQSVHESPCSVFGVLYLPLATNITPVKDVPKTSPLPTSGSQFMTTQFKVRKAPDQLGRRSIYNSTKKVLLSAVESFGDEDALFYLESAVEKLKKRKRDEFEELEGDEEEIAFPDEENDEELREIGLEDEDRVVEAASNFAVKYITYTEEDKTEILALFQVILEVARERNIIHCELAAARTTVIMLKENMYYSRLNHRTVTRWYEGRSKTKMARGRKINEDFEEEIWGKLMHCILQKDNIVRVLVNVIYSYAIVITAAKSVQEAEHWNQEEKINNLVFSHKWVKNFLTRGGVSRRKITSEDKVIPSDEEIRRILKIGQDMYIARGHEPHTCYNFDETAFTYAIGPSHMWCPNDQQRATNIGISNDKLRITAVIAVSGLGHFAPLMLILKHSQSSEAKPDQTKMKVITELFKKEGFRAEDGWVKDIWEKSLTIKGVTALHRCTYIRHTTTGHVITSQCKAWNDTTRMVMWFELVMKPIKEEHGKLMIWCDNCGSHKTSSVRDVITETAIDVAFLPPNMTGELQVLDLVVNGPIKAHVKNKRASRLYESFQLFKKDVLTDMELPREQRKNLEFSPPKPTMLEGMKDLILLFQEQFKESKFQDCINRSFIKTGTLPQEPGSPTFIPYTKVSSCGTLAVIPQGTLELESEETTEDYSQLAQEQDLERALFARYIDNIDRIEEEEEQEQEESNESDRENSD